MSLLKSRYCRSSEFLSRIQSLMMPIRKIMILAKISKLTQNYLIINLASRKKDK